jgi:glutathione S-transferase
MERFHAPRSTLTRPSPMKLVIANKNYSSWSLRAWLGLKHTGVDFEEVLIPLDQPETRANILEYSPSGNVPVLIDDGLIICESLAILEYLAEKYPSARIWPHTAYIRAQARSISAEMLSGFRAFRSACPMNLRRPVGPRSLDAAAMRDVERIMAIWREARSNYVADGPFLFGSFTAADAMFAPVATRFVTYDIPRDALCQHYIDAIYDFAPFKLWQSQALQESWIVPSDEVDWPDVRRWPRAVPRPSKGRTELGMDRD